MKRSPIHQSATSLKMNSMTPDKRISLKSSLYEHSLLSGVHKKLSLQDLESKNDIAEATEKKRAAILRYQEDEFDEKTLMSCGLHDSIGFSMEESMHLKTIQDSAKRTRLAQINRDALLESSILN